MSRGHTVSSHPFFRGLRAPLHISHRGGAKLYPENTLYAFERAVSVHHTDMLELDLHATRDGELVVAHDETLERCTDGAGPLSALTWAELSRLDAAFNFAPAGAQGTPLRGRGVRIPRFVDVLRAFPALRLNVELKHAGALARFVALVRAERCLERLCIGSEHDDVGAALFEAMPEGCHFYPRDALANLIISIRGGDAPADDRYTVLDMPLSWEGMTVFDAALARVAGELGKWVNVWTVDEPADMRLAIEHGVGGVMTDRPDLLRAVLDGPSP